MRYFRTPKQTGHPPECWWGCGHYTAGQLYIFCGCPFLKSCWEDSYCTVSNVLEYVTEFTCLSFLLGNLNLNTTSKAYKYILK